MSDFSFRPLPETEDPFLVELNQKNLGPKDYAAALLVEHGLNRQQILAIAPIVWVMEQMWLCRSNLASCIADGSCNESCNCLWLGAGGSGKTYAYSKVLRPLFRRFFGQGGYVGGQNVAQVGQRAQEQQFGSPNGALGQEQGRSRGEEDRGHDGYDAG